MSLRSLRRFAWCASLSLALSAAGCGGGHAPTAATVTADGYFETAGLSGLNPNGRHHVVVLKR